MNKRQKMILESLKASEIKDEKLIKLNELTQNLIDLTRKKLELLQELKISYCVEYSQKNYIVIIDGEIFESDSSNYDYNYLFSDNEIKIYKTKKLKLSEAS